MSKSVPVSLYLKLLTSMLNLTLLSKLFQIPTRLQRIVQEMNEDLLQVRNWCVENRLLLNPDKTKFNCFRELTDDL